MNTGVKPTPGSVQHELSGRVPDPTPTGVGPARAPVNDENARRRIAELAYSLWQKRGCPNGHADEIWLEAERRLSAR